MTKAWKTSIMGHATLRTFYVDNKARAVVRTLNGRTDAEWFDIRGAAQSQNFPTVKDAQRWVEEALT